MRLECAPRTSHVRSNHTLPVGSRVRNENSQSHRSPDQLVVTTQSQGRQVRCSHTTSARLAVLSVPLTWHVCPISVS